MLHELRIYRAAPAKLAALHARFEQVTLPLWKKHGIQPVGFWTTLIGQSNMDLTYLLQWADMADRERRWNAFAGDPEWLEKKAGTEKDGPLVENVTNQLLAPTAYSPMR